jgi:predicted MPP superfamily phosphohydrolase
VLLAHHPERIMDYARAGVDLALSGHAHGGQVRLFGHGLFSPDQGILPRYTSGVYARDKTQLYVSRGAGNHSFLPPRVFNRPQIDLITLKAKTPSR